MDVPGLDSDGFESYDTFQRLYTAGKEEIDRVHKRLTTRDDGKLYMLYRIKNNADQIMGILEDLGNPDLGGDRGRD